MKKIKTPPVSRRNFIKTSAMAMAIPYFVPSSVFGKNAPSNRINIGAIGNGRISISHDMPGIWQYDSARIIAVCDLDANRVRSAKALVDKQYTRSTGKSYNGTQTYDDYRNLIDNKDIDAVIISTPDHWHAKVAIDAARAGKHIYMQKPCSLTIAEGRAVSDEVQKSGVIFQIGSQQRSSPQFRYACELVRNGRIGDIKKVYVGLPGDPGGPSEPEMPIPSNLNYDMWLGSTPEVYYTENRVHPQVGYDRPGWLRCEQFGAGMITGWGAHHVDTAHLGMGTELTGPVEVWGKADFPTSGLWNVHGIFTTEAMYANGVLMIVSNELPNGIKFEGTEGWVWVTRGAYRATESDPIPENDGVKSLDASDPKILTSKIGADEIRFAVSDEHHGNWLAGIKANKQGIAPVEEAHRSCSACLLHHIAMKLPRKLYWDPIKEQFKNDPEANAMLSREQRKPYALPASR